MRRLLAVDHVVTISVDGLASRWLEPLIRQEQVAPTGDYANFLRLQREGAFTLNARTDVTHTVTLPNHATMVTGRPVLVPSGLEPTVSHNWTGNGDPPIGATIHSNHAAVDYVSSVFDVVHDRGLSTALFASKTKFSLFEASYNGVAGAVDEDPVGGDNGRDKIDTFLALTDTQQIADQFVFALGRQQYAYSFLHLASPDGTGHQYGWGSVEWNNVIKDIDRNLGQVFDVIESSPGLRDRTVVVLTSDHGGVGTGHFDVTDVSNYRIPFYVWGPGFTAGSNLYSRYSTTVADPGLLQPSYTADRPPIRNGDAGNLALDLLGLPPIPDAMIRSLHSCQQDDCSAVDPPPVVDEFDFGDAPAPFPTMAEEAGASHRIEVGFHLGQGVDGESNGLPDPQALGDDRVGDDEDGVTFGEFIVGRSAELDVVASDTGILQAWFDWNGDGDWNDPQEHALADQRLSAGQTRMTVRIPADVDPADIFARFRFSRQAGLPPIGPAEAGEVEDYVVSMKSPPIIGEVDAEDDLFRIRTGSGRFALNVLTNDRGSPPLAITNVTQPRQGTTEVSDDGTVIWFTPADGFVGDENFRYQVRDATGAVGAANVTVEVERRPVVQTSRAGFRFEVTDDLGAEVTDVDVGTRFWLALYARDLRPGGPGIRSAYVDVVFDGNLSADGPIEHGNRFNQQTSGVVINGQINEVGGQSNELTGNEEVLLFRVPLVANAAGVVNFSLEPADSAGNDVRLQDESSPIPESRWVYSPAELQLNAVDTPPTEPLDVDGDGFITPLDALLVINDLNENGPRNLAGGVPPQHPVDVNGDGSIAAIDALLIINRLNQDFLEDPLDRAIAAAVAAVHLDDQQRKARD